MLGTLPTPPTSLRQLQEHGISRSVGPSSAELALPEAPRSFSQRPVHSQEAPRPPAPRDAQHRVQHYCGLRATLETTLRQMAPPKRRCPLECYLNQVAFPKSCLNICFQLDSRAEPPTLPDTPQLYFSRVDRLRRILKLTRWGLWCKFVNFGANKSPTTPDSWDQIRLRLYLAQYIYQLVPESYLPYKSSLTGETISKVHISQF